MVSRALKSLAITALLACGLSACVNDDAPCGGTCPPESCVNSACLAAVCDADTPCGRNLYCDSSYGRCREGCEAAAALCDDGRICGGDSHRCSECSDAKPCPTGRCEAGRCIECAEDAECGLGLGRYCRSGVCVEGCLRNEHCPTSTVCDTTAEACVDCIDDNSCPDGTTCDLEERRCR